MAVNITPPKSRRQKRKNMPDRAFVEIDGRRHYLGRYGTPESNERYQQLVAEWAANGRKTPIRVHDSFTLIEFCAAFWQSVEDAHNVRHLARIKSALKPLKALYGNERVEQFGPLSLQAVRQRMIEEGYARSTINSMVGVIRQMFRWGVKNEYVRADVLAALQAVDGLKRGRSNAKETDPVRFQN
jgi:hypothetical protein